MKVGASRDYSIAARMPHWQCVIASIDAFLRNAGMSSIEATAGAAEEQRRKGTMAAFQTE